MACQGVLLSFPASRLAAVPNPKRWTVEIDFQHWAVIGAPLVFFAGVAIFFLMRRHKEKPPDDHMYK
jgi:hypothetical protein